MQHLSYKKNRKCQAEFQKRLKLLTPPGPHGKTGDYIASATEQNATPIEPRRLQRSLDFGQVGVNHQQQQEQQEQQQDDADILPPDDDNMDWEPEEAGQEQQQPGNPPNAAAVNHLDDHETDKYNEAFREYVKDSIQNRCWMDTDTQAGIELMNLLHQNGIVSLYDTIVDWHLTYLEAKKRVTKTQLLDKLRKRYNMEKCQPFITRVTLPSSGVKARIPCHDAWAMMVDLLTDPRIVAEDYLWFDDDPFGQPPAEWLNLVDINDGLAYRRTYEELISPQPFTNSGRRRVLLPVICYMDGTVTGFNENLAIEFMKFTLGIYNSKGRDKDHLWRNLGAVPQFQAVKAKAVDLLQKSGHVDAHGYVSQSESDTNTPNVRTFTHEFDFSRYINSSDDEESMCDIQVPDTEAQDLHVILQVIMHGMKQIFRTGGFEWDLFHRGEVKKVQFIPFLLFIKGDTAEHDKLTGRYSARAKGVKSLCRYCVCPTDQIDNPYADHARKLPQMLADLIRKEDMAALKQLSQQYLFNAWYEFGFGLHNDLSIHGACPMELLHWIQLGMYKYSRSSLFE